MGGGDDDAYERGTGFFDRTGDYVWVRSYPDEASAYYQCGGFRFPNVTIPQASTITAAKVSVCVEDIDWDDMNTVIYGNDVDNAVDFLANPNIINQAQRPRTVANVIWVQDSLGVGWKEKAGLQSIIQEIVNRPGWSSGNALVLLFIANTDIAKECKLFSYNGNPSKAAKLDVSWTAVAVARRVFMDGFSCLVY